MDLKLQGETAIIFGGARGLGYAIAEQFRAEQAHIILADRLAVTPQIAENLGGFGAILDVTSLDAVMNFAETVTKQVGRIDHVVYSIGIGSGQFGFPYWNVHPSVWQQVYLVNVIGAVQVAHVFGPRLAEQKAGTMLFLSSVAGQIGSQTDPPYSAAKAALINFAQCAAKDLAPYGVRVNTLCPGMVQTELNRSVWQAWANQQTEANWKSYEDWTTEKIAKVIPLNRWQSPEDIARMAVFLASRAAHNITGQTINVDGGFVMHW